MNKPSAGPGLDCLLQKKKVIREVNVNRLILSMKKMEAEKHEKFSYFSAGYFPAFGIYHSLIYFMFS